MVLITRQGLHSTFLHHTGVSFSLPKYVAFALIRMFGLQSQLQWCFRLGGGRGGLNTTKWLNTVMALLNAGWPQQVSEAATDDLFLCLCLNIFMQKKMRAIICDNMQPKPQLSSKVLFVTV